MARTKKQKEEENDEEYESYTKIVYGIIFVVAIFIFNRCSNSSNNNDVKIIKQYECSSADNTIHHICGIVQNNERKDLNISIKVDYYDADGVKVDSDSDHIKVDAKGGKTNFQTFGTTKSYRKYKVYIGSAY